MSAPLYAFAEQITWNYNIVAPSGIDYGQLSLRRPPLTITGYAIFKFFLVIIAQGV